MEDKPKKIVLTKETLQRLDHDALDLDALPEVAGGLPGIASDTCNSCNSCSVCSKTTNAVRTVPD